jgi:hypothetical protein
LSEMEAVRHVRIVVDADTYSKLLKLAEREGGLERALELAIRRGIERYKDGLVSDMVADYTAVLGMTSSYEADNALLKALFDQNERLAAKLREMEGSA